MNFTLFDRKIFDSQGIKGLKFTVFLLSLQIPTLF